MLMTLTRLPICSTLGASAQLALVEPRLGSMGCPPQNVRWL